MEESVIGAAVVWITVKYCSTACVRRAYSPPITVAITPLTRRNTSCFVAAELASLASKPVPSTLRQLLESSPSKLNLPRTPAEAVMLTEKTFWPGELTCVLIDP